MRLRVRDSMQPQRANSPFNFSDADLLARMRNFEDHFTERKAFGDDRDWLKTVVAFANSAPIDFPCILFIGVTDNGEIQAFEQNLDTMQQKLDKKLASAYPRIPYFTRVFGEAGKQALAVIVAGSRLRPHFSGAPFVRRGSKTVEMTDDDFREALAWRDSKAGRILEYLGRRIRAINIMGSGYQRSESHWGEMPVVEYCDSHYVILRQSGGAKSTIPLGHIQLSFDTSGGGTLVLEIHR